MNEIIKPAEFQECADSIADFDGQIRLLSEQRNKMLTRIAEMFTTWRIGDWLSLSINKKKTEKYMILGLTLYSEHHLREPIYDEQFVVQISVIRSGKGESDLTRHKFLLFSNGDIADDNIRLTGLGRI